MDEQRKRGAQKGNKNAKKPKSRKVEYYPVGAMRFHKYPVFDDTGEWFQKWTQDHFGGYIAFVRHLRALPEEVRQTIINN